MGRQNSKTRQSLTSQAYSEVVESFSAAEFRDLTAVKPLFTNIQRQVKYLMRLSAVGDNLSQTLHSQRTAAADTLVRLWPLDPARRIGEVINTHTIYTHRGAADIHTARYLFGLSDGSYNFLAQSGDGFYDGAGAPVLSGEAPAIWHEGDRTIITPTNRPEAYPPALDADIEAFVLAKDAIHNLAHTIGSIGPTTIVNNFHFTNTL